MRVNGKMEPGMLQITLSLPTLKRILFMLMGFVVSAGLAAEVALSVFGLRKDEGWVPIFSLSYEQNVPTWYSSALLLVCSMLLALCATYARKKGAGYVRHWWLLAIAFLYISVDETVSIHE